MTFETTHPVYYTSEQRCSEIAQTALWGSFAETAATRFIRNNWPVNSAVP